MIEDLKHYKRDPLFTVEEVLVLAGIFLALCLFLDFLQRIA